MRVQLTPTRRRGPAHTWPRLKRAAQMTLRQAAPSLWIFLLIVIFDRDGRDVLGLLVEVVLYAWAAYWLLTGAVLPLVRRWRRRDGRAKASNSAINSTRN